MELSRLRSASLSPLFRGLLDGVRVDELLQASPRPRTPQAALSARSCRGAQAPGQAVQNFALHLTPVRFIIFTVSAHDNCERIKYMKVAVFPIPIQTMSLCSKPSAAAALTPRYISATMTGTRSSCGTKFPGLPVYSVCGNCDLMPLAPEKGRRSARPGQGVHHARAPV